MADVQYSVECITGLVRIRKRPLVYFYVHNRGDNDEYAEISLWQLRVEQGAPTELFTSQPRLIPRGEAYVTNYNPVEVDPYWDPNLLARIKVTSAQLIPSVHFLQGEALESNQSVAAYYGPGDFARFDLPRAPVIGRPPVDPPA